MPIIVKGGIMRIHHLFTGIIMFFCIMTVLFAQNAEKTDNNAANNGTPPASPSGTPASTDIQPPTAEELKAQEVEKKRYEHILRTMRYGANNDRKNAIVMIAVLKNQDN